MTNKLHIKKVDFHAAHYLSPKFDKCYHLHGHTYTFEDIVIETEGVVDFSTIKQTLTRADHTLLVPEKDVEFWAGIDELVECPCAILPFPIKGDETTVEAISQVFKEALLRVKGVKAVSFKLYETLNSGMEL